MSPNLSMPTGGFASDEDKSVFLSRAVAASQRRLMRQAFSIIRDWHAAEDIVQEAFADLHRALSENGHITDIDAWLSRVTHRIAVEHVRKAVRREGVHAQVRPGLSEAPLPLQALEEEELQRAVLAAIPHLPDQQAAVVRMRHIEELSHEQIAWRLDCEISTVRNAYRQGLIRLRGVLKQHPSQEESP